MRLQSVLIDVIDRESFLRYGDTVEIHRPDPGKAQRGEDEYRILSRAQSSGWRVAMHCVRTRWTKELYSYESRRLLSPRSGTALLCVAPPGRLQNVQLFLLDVPVTINEGVPHCLLTLSLESWIEIVEPFESRYEARELRKTLIPVGLWD